MTNPFDSRLRQIRFGTLAASLSLVVASSAEPATSAADSPGSLSPEQRAEKFAAEREVAREKLNGFQEKVRAQKTTIATLTAEIAAKEKELAELTEKMAKENGTDTSGRPVIKKRVIELPARFLADVTPRVVVIEGDRGKGTGFLCVTEGQLWVYTAAHVLSGNRQITVRDSSGRVYREFEYLECAEGVDLVRLKPKNPDFQGLELVTPEEAPKIGDTIVAVGNSLGTGSLSGEPGKVRSISEKMWEVDAEIIPGNSGGPVFALNTGKVVGIVTHLIIRHGEGQEDHSKVPEVKRFAARLDKKWEWRRMPVSRFVKEWEYIEKMNRESSVSRTVEEIGPKGNQPAADDFCWFHRQSYEAELRRRNRPSPPTK
jgi:S1-C subfamily serine protease